MTRLFIILGLFGIVFCNGNILIDKLRLDFLKMEEQMWKYVLWETSHLDYATSEKYIVDHFTEFDQHLKMMPEEILRGLEPVKHIHSFIILYPELRQTENLYEKFRQYLQEQKIIRETNEKIIEDIIDSDEIVRDILNKKLGANTTVHKVYDLTFGEENMLMKVLELLEEDYYCKNFFQSPQQVYYNLYNAVALNGLKSYIMMQFTYLIQEIEEGGKSNYSDLAIINRNNFEKRVNLTMTVIRGAMELVSLDIWRCDPTFHVQGKTYDEFTRLIQGHVQNEVDMNSKGTCTKNCAAYSMSTNHGCYDKDSRYCKEMEKCNGRIIECRFIESHMDICVAKSQNRRYEYIKFDNTYYGKKTNCWNKPVNSWYRWFVHCSYCICLCDDPNKLSDRFISLRPVLSDIKNNRVVTGIKLVKVDRILHLQIQEGQLLPFGYINQSTVHWVPVDAYKITDPGVFDGKDYFKMSYERRAMALDNVKIDKQNYVVTGVRFQMIDNKVKLQVHINEVDWDNGIVVKSADNYIYKATGGFNKLFLDSNPDVPTLSPPSVLKYDNGMFVEFTHTGFYADAAQTTIPFIDIQPVYNEPAVPLKGVGIQYKGYPRYGGFITPTIFTYDYSKLLLARFSKNDFRTTPVYEVEVN